MGTSTGVQAFLLHTCVCVNKTHHPLSRPSGTAAPTVLGVQSNLYSCHLKLKPQLVRLVGLSQEDPGATLSATTLQFPGHRPQHLTQEKAASKDGGCVGRSPPEPSRQQAVHAGPLLLERRLRGPAPQQTRLILQPRCTSARPTASPTTSPWSPLPFALH